MLQPAVECAATESNALSSSVGEAVSFPSEIVREAGKLAASPTETTTRRTSDMKPLG
jgi:hypothetical protein